LRQDPQYFLTQGNGPWGNRTWTYDKTGNRLTYAETGDATQTYTYVLNGGSRNTSKLNRITPAPGYGTGFLQFTYDPAGNETSILENDGEGTFKTLFRDYSEESQIISLRSTPNQARTDMLYDGRGFMRQANQTFTGSTDFTTVTPTYSSEGVLYALQEQRQIPPRDDDADAPVSNPPLTSNEITTIFYFAGRPVAQWNNGGELLYLTTDHLGTPILAMSDVGVVVWAGGVEPFGKAWSAGGDNPDPESAGAEGSASGQEAVLSRLTSDKVFLRYPGQWASDAFRVDPRGADLYYNVFRWYEAGSGRYTRVDPTGLRGEGNAFAYARSQPVLYFDLLGDKSRTCCTSIASAPILRAFKHCFIQTVDDVTGRSSTNSLHGMGTPARSWGGPIGCTFVDDSFDTSAVGSAQTDCGPWAEGCGIDNCVSASAASYPAASAYSLRGPNSNTFASDITQKCGLTPPPVADTWRTPGWGKPVPPQIFFPALGSYPLRCPRIR
jgi:RHS repeat-associated protein